MVEPLTKEPPFSQPSKLDQVVAKKEVRKLGARKQKIRTLFFGLGMFGLIGWSVAIPTILGVALGLLVDRTWPSGFSFTLALLIAGAMLGALNAWYWVSKEQAAMDQDRERGSHA